MDPNQDRTVQAAFDGYVKPSEWGISHKAATEMMAEISRLRTALFEIMLLDGKRLTSRQRWDHAVTLAKRAYDRPAPTAGQE